jgi:hypothetical protein
MPQRLSDEACKGIIRRIARKLGVEPRLITTRLMSEDDKNDMRNGDLPQEALELHVKVWMENGMPDYVNINTEDKENSSVHIQSQRDEPC